jgi:hypothetical protein
MSFLPWLLLAVLAVIVVVMMMRGNKGTATGLAPNGQPFPLQTTGNPQANQADATARAIAQSVTAAFGLVTQLVNNSNSQNP